MLTSTCTTNIYIDNKDSSERPGESPARCKLHRGGWGWMSVEDAIEPKEANKRLIGSAVKLDR